MNDSDSDADVLLVLHSVRGGVERVDVSSDWAVLDEAPSTVERPPAPSAPAWSAARACAVFAAWFKARR